jgi:hypothetical protein
LLQAQGFWGGAPKQCLLDQCDQGGTVRGTYWCRCEQSYRAGAGPEQSWDPSRPMVSSLTRAVLSAAGVAVLLVLSVEASLLLSPWVVSELSISRVSVTVSGNKRDYL